MVRKEKNLKTLTDEKKILRIKVPGIDCPDCASGLQEEVKKVEGVESVEYNIASCQLKVVGGGRKLKRQTIFSSHCIR